LITRIIFGDEYRSLSFSLCSLRHSPVASSLLGPSILLSNVICTLAALLLSAFVIQKCDDVVDLRTLCQNKFFRSHECSLIRRSLYLNFFRMSLWLTSLLHIARHIYRLTAI
jgi:hypothetical protein